MVEDVMIFLKQKPILEAFGGLSVVFYGSGVAVYAFEGVSLVALMVLNFGDFLSLVGSSVSCILGYVLPALFHLLVFKEEMKWNGIVLDVAIMILELVFAVLGTCKVFSLGDFLCKGGRGYAGVMDASSEDGRRADFYNVILVHLVMF
ncbi:hypothetical protein IFM89_035221 [Coptis chinensis]|uniref:Amino acid transporter transmembrane domain-containing protein n=1 Tax=Coptis chinensis TaxID=261450 RepID=A0A835IIW8_9MAGN|nr:hypothetical protein IFM89_035221 [Coptis chinensis]